MAAGTLPRLPRSARGLSRPRSDCRAAHGPAVFHVKQPVSRADVPVKGGRGRKALSPALAVPDALGTKAGRLVDGESADAGRLAALGPFATPATTPGRGVVRAGNLGRRPGYPHRWPEPSQIYRVAGLPPAQDQSAGKRGDGSISRDGSVALLRP